MPADAGWAAAAASSAALPVASAGSSARLLSTALPGCEADPRLGTVGSKAAAAASAVAASNNLGDILDEILFSTQALKRNDAGVSLNNCYSNLSVCMQFRKTCKRYRWLASRRNSNSR